MPQLDVKQAVQSAKAFVPTAFEGEEVTQVRLEEVSFDESRNVWLITLGLSRPSFTTRAGQILATLGDAPVKRSYKVFEVADNSGQVVGFKMRSYEE